MKNANVNPRRSGLFAANLIKGLLPAAVALLLSAELGMFGDFFYPFRFLWDQERVGELLFASFVLFWSLLGAFLIFFSARSPVRKITLPFFLFCALFNLGTFDIANAPLDFQQAVIITENFQWWIGAAAENFGLALLPGILVFVPAAVLAERLPDLSPVRFPKKAYGVPLGALLLVYLVMDGTQGLVDRYPSFFRIPSLLLLATRSPLYDGERSGVVYSAPLDAPVDKIVLIVDESIRADLLGINGYPGETTPFLRALKTGIVNFGRAASASNCSDYSNLILRTGARKEEIPDEAQVTLKRPSIWQFTKHAGYANVYLDAQSAEAWENYQNFMNAHEAAAVDTFVRLRQEAAYESDGAARERLAALLKQPGKTFIMLNKYGLHFPYFRSYPETDAFFAPVLAPGEPMHDREKALNSYMNGLRWAVDAWFESLLSEREAFGRYVIIYTGDHGQNILDDGTLATHCRPGATRFEGMVPMMVFSNDAAVLQRLRAALASGYDRTSHFQVFPTLLRLAGYDGAWVEAHYGASLGDAPAAPPAFFTGDIHGRGSVRKWMPLFPADAGERRGAGE